MNSSPSSSERIDEGIYTRSGFDAFLRTTRITARSSGIRIGDESGFFRRTYDTGNSGTELMFEAQADRARNEPTHGHVSITESTTLTPEALARQMTLLKQAGLADELIVASHNRLIDDTIIDREDLSALHLMLLAQAQQEALARHDGNSDVVSVLYGYPVILSMRKMLLFRRYMLPSVQYSSFYSFDEDEYPINPPESSSIDGDWGDLFALTDSQVELQTALSDSDVSEFEHALCALDLIDHHTCTCRFSSSMKD